MYALPSKPQEIGPIFNNGTRLLIAGIKPVAIILLIMIVIEVALFALYGDGLAKISTQLQKGQVDDIQYGDLLSFMLPLMLVYFLFTNAMIAVYSAVANARPISLAVAFSIAIRKLLPVFGYGVLYNLILTVTSLPAFVLIILFQSHGILAFLLGLLALLPPTILGLSLYFGNYLIVADNAGVIESLVRSHQLVRGNLVRTGIYLSLIILIQFASVFLAVSTLITPVIIALIIPYLNDLKLRKTTGGGNLAA